MLVFNFYNITSHHTPLCTTLHYTTLYYITVHIITLHHTMHYTALHYITFVLLQFLSNHVYVEDDKQLKESDLYKFKA